MRKELVLAVPTQVKDSLNIGNIYEFTLADFYNKVKKMQGYEVEFCVIWNANGKPIEEAVVRKDGRFSVERAEKLVSDMIVNSNITMNQFYIEPDFQIRDDKIQDDLERCIDKHYRNIVINGLADVAICLECGSEFGSDTSITTCKHCGSGVHMIKKNTLFTVVQKNRLDEKMKRTFFYPEGCKKRLDELIRALPTEYKIILEKNRKYTLSYNGYKLDPRFVTIFTLPIIKEMRDEEYDVVTVFQGDVVKKYDYYAFAYLADKDCPGNIFMHGLIVNGEKKKLRWRSDNSNTSGMVFPGVKSKEFRAFLLSHNITDNIMIDENTLKKDVKGQVNLYITMKRLLDQRNLDSSLYGIRDELREYYEEFIFDANRMKLHDAYECMYNFVSLCWKITKNSKLSSEEQQLVSTYMKLYYGD